MPSNKESEVAQRGGFLSRFLGSKVLCVLNAFIYFLLVPEHSVISWSW
jgi:hypothetical protein